MSPEEATKTRPSDNRPNLTTMRLCRFISELPQGKTFTSIQCMQYGPRTSVDQALCRMVKAGRIVRVAYGVFVRNDDQAPLPSVAEIAEAKAKAFGKQIYIHGRQLARKFRLLEAEQEEQARFLVHASSSSFNTIHQRVYFEHASPRRTRIRGSKAAQMVAALWHLGKQRVTAAEVQKATFELFRDDMIEVHAMGGLMPAWLSRLVCRTWRWGAPRAADL